MLMAKIRQFKEAKEILMAVTEGESRSSEHWQIQIALNWINTLANQKIN